MSRDRGAEHPDLERYYDRATDRAAVDAHLATCDACRAWLARVNERLRDLACNEVVELLTGYLDDAVDDDLRARIDDHLRVCEHCRTYLEQMRVTIATIGQLSGSGASEPTDAVRAGLLAAFRSWRDDRPRAL
jgi:predicted anti-sigma-YlaC factor YlaD